MAQTYRMRSRLYGTKHISTLTQRHERRTYPLSRCLHPQADARSRPRYVNLDLVPYLLVQTIPPACEGGLHERSIFTSLSSKCRRTRRFRKWQIALSMR